MSEAIATSAEFDRSLEELTDEVFHVLFNDLGFLQHFNRLIAGYIGQADFDPDSSANATKGGTLRRVAIPAWVRKAIYFRDRGECRTCKRTLAMTVNQTEFERYDHIVPLASHGANDVTNLQLLCEECNLKKSACSEPVSSLYLRALQR
jgi:5-methylcytosine-specific restriction endonuclease McrA